MKKLILPAICGFLLLWLLIGCGETAQDESASIPPTQHESDTAATQTIDPGDVATDTPAPSETAPGTPPLSETDSGTPESAEVTSDAPIPSEDVSGTPPPVELVSSDPPLGSDSAVTLIYQNPELPNGCEITSLAMLLVWAGYPVDKVELSDNYLPKQAFSTLDEVRYGPDPNQAYAGSPSSAEGWYCFEGPVLEAGNAWLSHQGSQLQAVLLSGLTREELEHYLDDDIPLAVWVTLDYTAPRTPAYFNWYLPDGSQYVPWSNLHCVVLAGRSGDYYLIANPINGWQTVSPDSFWSCFDAMGRRAVAVLP